MARTLIIKGADFSDHYIEKVTFADVPCTGLSIDKSTITLENTTDTSTITATVTPANTTDAIIWTSSNPDIAKVINGVVSATGIGTATITVQCGNYSATCAVTCEGKVDFFYSKGAFLIKQDANDYAHFTSTSATDAFVVGEQTGTLHGTDNQSADGWIYPLIVPKNAAKICCRCTTQYWGIKGLVYVQSAVESAIQGTAKAVGYIKDRSATGWGDKTYNGVACWGNDIVLPTDITFDALMIRIGQYGSAALTDADVAGTHLWFETAAE